MNRPVILYFLLGAALGMLLTFSDRAIVLGWFSDDSNPGNTGPPRVSRRARSTMTASSSERAGERTPEDERHQTSATIERCPRACSDDAIA